MISLAVRLDRAQHLQGFGYDESPLAFIGIKPTGFNRLLSIRFYEQIDRTRLEDVSSINRFIVFQTKAPECSQVECI